MIQIAAGRPGLGVDHFLLDGVDQLAAQIDRRDGDLLERGRLGIAGDEIEELRRVAAERRIGGEQRQVGVNLGGVRMVVAGAEMHVGMQRAGLAAHHEAHFRVGLEFDEAIDHLDAGAFEIAGPFDVGGLVEAGFQLDQCGDGFAGFRGLHQGGDDRAVGRGAIERLLDRHDVWGRRRPGG